MHRSRHNSISSAPKRVINRFFIILLIHSPNNLHIYIYLFFHTCAETATDIALLGIRRNNPLAVLEFDWVDKKTVLIYIQSLLRRTSAFHYSNHMTRDAVSNVPCVLTHVSECILDTFSSLLNQSSDSRSLNIAYQLLCGPQINCCEVLVNTLVMDLPPSYLYGGQNNVLYCEGSGTVRRKDLVVAVFDCSLEFPNPNHSIHYEIAQYGNNNIAAKNHEPTLEQKILDHYASMLKRSHVDVVCCQKRIHPFLKRKLLSLGIRSLSNISVRYMGAIVQISVHTS